MIMSNPAGATVRSLRSGAEICQTPCPYEDTETNGHVEGFAIELPGYKSKTIQIKRDQMNGGRLVGFLVPGILLWPFLLGGMWVTDYRPQYGVTLQPDDSGAATFYSRDQEEERPPAFE